MAINRKIKTIIITALFLSGLSAVQAQTVNYYLDPNSIEPRFIQRLAWSGGAYSLHYEVILENEKDGNYVNYLRKITTDHFMELSMPPGNYRFRVIPYDILGKPSVGTQWAPFVVYSAIKPELFQPEEEFEYYNDRYGSKFYFNGNNIEPDAQIYFVSSEGEYIIPAEVNRYYDGSGVNLVFEKKQLTDGEYEVIVINPGGLETSMGGIDYKSYREKFGLMHYVLGASFMPSFQAYGEGMSSNGFLYYINARVSVISCMFSSNYIGMEFAVSWYSKVWEEMFYESNGFTTGFSLVFINWLPGRKAAVNFKIGIGFDMRPMDLNYTIIGASFLYRIYSNLYAETGVNFSQPIKNSSSGDIQPWLGITYFF